MSGTVPGIVLIIAAILTAGCSGTGAGGPLAMTGDGVISLAGQDGPRFATGDVIRLPDGDPNAGMLILGYDPDADQYEARGVGRIYYAYGAEDGIWVWLDIKGRYPRDRVDRYSVRGDHIADAAMVRDTP
ncbi:MAG: hypothetical protein LUO88_01440 [Methanoregulaceae archaeon]|nr:hypothetical protein [Methanoregulaceae archaeon]